MSENEPSKEAIDGLAAAAPDLRPEMMRRLTSVAKCLRAALADERVDEVGQAWLRTALAKIEDGKVPDYVSDHEGDSEMTHRIRIQAWGDRAVVVCLDCKPEGGDPTKPVVAMARGAGGITLADAVAAIEAHTGEGAFRATGSDSGGEQVPGQTTFGPEEQNERLIEEPDLVAFGNEPEFGPGYHPRTGQKLEPGHLRTDGGPSTEEYLRSKGEL